jgi:hypothetical protein
VKVPDALQTEPTSVDSAALRGAPTPARRWLPTWIRRPLRWLGKLFRWIAQCLLVTWATLAIYFSNLPWPWARIALALTFAAFAVWALWIPRRTEWRWAFIGVFFAVVIWWIAIPPSHDRPWRPEVAVMPRVVVDGDRVRLIDVRNFYFRTREDFDPRYETREISLAHMVSLDLFISYWSKGPVAHTFLSFGFDDATPPVCISIETRPEIGESFDPLASMFKQFELIYVVGDEKDIVRVRTNVRHEDVFLYHIRTTPERTRALFRVYVDRINHLAEHPEWYHLLSNNCTLNIIRYARVATGWGSRFDHRHFFNGLIDRYAFGAGILDTSLSFEELRRRSHINAAANAAGDASDFSARIRVGLPVPTPE